MKQTRLAMMWGSVAMIAVTASPALAAKHRVAPPPLSLYPSVSSCPTGAGSPTWVLDSSRNTSNEGCVGITIGTAAGRTDEDYTGTANARGLIGRAGAISGVVNVKALAPQTGSDFVGYADVMVTLTVNGYAFPTVEQQGSIQPGSPLSIKLSDPIPAAMRGRPLRGLDLLVHWKVAGGIPVIDYGTSQITIPRS
jgi:hypothetical protein